MRVTRRNKPFFRTVGAIAAANMMITPLMPVFALNWSDATVVSGAAIGNTDSGVTDVIQGTQKAIYNWGGAGFNLVAGEKFNLFNGANGFSLIRDITGIGSEILGAINAQGNLMIVNKAGVLIGTDATIDVGKQFAAVAGDVSNENFDKWAAGNSFTIETVDSGTGVKLEVLGAIKAGANVLLFGNRVELGANAAVQSAGTLAIAAAQSAGGTASTIVMPTAAKGGTISFTFDSDLNAGDVSLGGKLAGNTAMDAVGTVQIDDTKTYTGKANGTDWYQAPESGNTHEPGQAANEFKVVEDSGTLKIVNPQTYDATGPNEEVKNVAAALPTGLDATTDALASGIDASAADATETAIVVKAKDLTVDGALTTVGTDVNAAALNDLTVNAAVDASAVKLEAKNDVVVKADVTAAKTITVDAKALKADGTEVTLTAKNAENTAGEGFALNVNSIEGKDANGNLINLVAGDSVGATDSAITLNVAGKVELKSVTANGSDKDVSITAKNVDVATVTAPGAVTLNGSEDVTAGAITAGADATLTGDNVTAAAITVGDSKTITITAADAAKLTGNLTAATEASAQVTAKTIEVGDTAAIDASKIDLALKGTASDKADVTFKSDVTTKSVAFENVNDLTVNSAVSADKFVADVAGNIDASAGKIKATDTTGDAISLKGATVKAGVLENDAGANVKIEATTGDAEITQAVTANDVTVKAGNDAKVSAAVTAAGATSITAGNDATISADVTGTGAIGITATAGKITATGAITGSDTVSFSAINGAAEINNDVTATDALTLNAKDVTIATGKTVSGKSATVAATGDVTFNGATLKATDGNVEVAAKNITAGEVAAAGDATLTGDNVTAAAITVGDSKTITITATDAAKLTGNLTAATEASAQVTAKTIEVGDTAAIDASKIDLALKGTASDKADVTFKSDVTTKSVAFENVNDLTVNSAVSADKFVADVAGNIDASAGAIKATDTTGDAISLKGATVKAGVLENDAGANVKIEATTGDAEITQAVTANDVTVKAGNDAKVSAAVTAAGATTIEAVNDATISAAVTAAGATSITAGNDATISADVTGTGAIGITATAGKITATGAITGSDTVSFNAINGAAEINNDVTATDALTLNAKDVTIATGKTVSGKSATVTATGDVTFNGATLKATDGNVEVAAKNITAGEVAAAGDATLTGDNVTAAAITVGDSKTITITATDAAKLTGNLTAGTDKTFTANVTAKKVTVGDTAAIDAAGGAVTLKGSESVTVAKALTAQSLTLSDSEAVKADANITADNITVKDSGAVTVAGGVAVTATEALKVQDSKSLTLGADATLGGKTVAADVAGAIDVSAGKIYATADTGDAVALKGASVKTGVMAKDSTTDLAGNVKIEATTGDAEITQAVTANDVTVKAGNDAKVSAAVTAAGATSITAGNDATISADVTGTGAIGITATAGKIKATGAISGSDSVTASAVTMELGKVATGADKALSLTATGKDASGDAIKVGQMAAGGEATVAADIGNVEFGALASDKHTAKKLTVNAKDINVKGALETTGADALTLTATGNINADAAITSAADAKLTGKNVTASAITVGDTKTITITADEDAKLTGNLTAGVDGSGEPNAFTANVTAKKVTVGDTAAIDAAGGAVTLKGTESVTVAKALTAQSLTVSDSGAVKADANITADNITVKDSGAVTVAGGVAVTATEALKVQDSKSLTLGADATLGGKTVAADVAGAIDVSAGKIYATADTGNAIDLKGASVKTGVMAKDGSSDLAAGVKIVAMTGNAEITKAFKAATVNVKAANDVKVAEDANIETTGDDSTLTLNAGNDISVKGTITAKKDAELDAVNNITVEKALTASNDAKLTAGKDIAVKAALTASNDAKLTAGKDITTDAAITADENVTIAAAAGKVNINENVTAGAGTTPANGKLSITADEMTIKADKTAKGKDVALQVATKADWTDATIETAGAALDVISKDITTGAIKMTGSGDNVVTLNAANDLKVKGALDGVKVVNGKGKNVTVETASALEATSTDITLAADEKLSVKSDVKAAGISLTGKTVEAVKADTTYATLDAAGTAGNLTITAIAGTLDLGNIKAKGTTTLTANAADPTGGSAIKVQTINDSTDDYKGGIVKINANGGSIDVANTDDDKGIIYGSDVTLRATKDIKVKSVVADTDKTISLTADEGNITFTGAIEKGNVTAIANGGTVTLNEDITGFKVDNFTANAKNVDLKSAVATETEGKIDLDATEKVTAAGTLTAKNIDVDASNIELKDDVTATEDINLKASETIAAEVSGKKLAAKNVNVTAKTMSIDTLNASGLAKLEATSDSATDSAIKLAKSESTGDLIMNALDGIVEITDDVKAKSVTTVAKTVKTGANGKMTATGGDLRVTADAINLAEANATAKVVLIAKGNDGATDPALQVGKISDDGTIDKAGDVILLAEQGSVKITGDVAANSLDAKGKAVTVENAGTTPSFVVDNALTLTATENDVKVNTAIEGSDVTIMAAGNIAATGDIVANDNVTAEAQLVDVAALKADGTVSLTAKAADPASDSALKVGTIEAVTAGNKPTSVNLIAELGSIAMSDKVVAETLAATAHQSISADELELGDGVVVMTAKNGDITFNDKVGGGNVNATAVNGKIEVTDQVGEFKVKSLDLNGKSIEAAADLESLAGAKLIASEGVSVAAVTAAEDLTVKGNEVTASGLLKGKSASIEATAADKDVTLKAGAEAENALTIKSAKDIIAMSDDATPVAQDLKVTDAAGTLNLTAAGKIQAGTLDANTIVGDAASMALANVKAGASADLTATGADGITLAKVESANAAVTLNATAGNITFNGEAADEIAAKSLDATASGDINVDANKVVTTTDALKLDAGGNIAVGDGATVKSTDGDITLTAVTDITVGDGANVNAVKGDITATAGGKLDVDGTLKADDGNVTATATGIELAKAIAKKNVTLTADTIDATEINANGAVALTAKGNADDALKLKTVKGVAAGDKPTAVTLVAEQSSVMMVADGSITADKLIVEAEKNATLETLTIADGLIDINARTGFITFNKDVTAATLNANAANATDGKISVNGDVAVTTFDAVAGNDFVLADDKTINASDKVTINAGNDATWNGTTAGTIRGANGVSVEAAQNITAGTTESTAGNVQLAALAGKINAADTTATAGDVNMSAGTEIDLDGDVTAAKKVGLEAKNGDITQADGKLVTAKDLVASAAEGKIAGEAADGSMATKVDTIAAAAKTGITITEADAVTVKTIDNTGTGNIDVKTTDGTMTIEKEGAVTAADGTITLAANGTGADLVTDENATIEASSDITLTAANDMTIGKGGNIKSSAGDIAMTAANAMTVNDGAMINAEAKAVTMTATAGQMKIDGAKVKAENATDGNITITAGANADLDDATVKAGVAAAVTGATGVTADNVEMTAGTDAKIDAGANADIDNTAMTAGNDATITAKTDADIDNATMTAGNDAKVTATEGKAEVTDSKVTAANDATVEAKGDATIQGVDMIAGNDASVSATEGDIAITKSATKFTTIDAASDVTVNAAAGNATIDNKAIVNAGNDIDLDAAKAFTIDDSKLVAQNTIDVMTTDATDGKIDIVNGASVSAMSSVTASAGTTLDVDASDITSVNNRVYVTAKQEITLTDATIKADVASNGNVKFRSMEGSITATTTEIVAGNNVDMDAKTDLTATTVEITAGNDVFIDTETGNVEFSDSDATAGNDILAKAGADMTLDNTDVTAVNNVRAEAEADVTLKNATELAAGNLLNAIAGENLTMTDASEIGAENEVLVETKGGDLTMSADSLIESANETVILSATDGNITLGSVKAEADGKSIKIFTEDTTGTKGDVKRAANDGTANLTADNVAIDAAGTIGAQTTDGVSEYIGIKADNLAVKAEGDAYVNAKQGVTIVRDVAIDRKDIAVDGTVGAATQVEADLAGTDAVDVAGDLRLNVEVTDEFVAGTTGLTVGGDARAADDVALKIDGEVKVGEDARIETRRGSIEQNADIDVDGNAALVAQNDFLQNADVTIGDDGTIKAGNDVVMADDKKTTVENGNLRLEAENGDVYIEEVAATTGSILVQANEGSIIDTDHDAVSYDVNGKATNMGDQDKDVTAGKDIVLSAKENIGAAGEKDGDTDGLDVTAGGVVAATAEEGNVALTNPDGDITIGDVSAADVAVNTPGMSTASTTEPAAADNNGINAANGTANIAASGAILDGNGDNMDINADKAVITAGTGAGTGDNAIEANITSSEQDALWLNTVQGSEGTVFNMSMPNRDTRDVDAGSRRGSGAVALYDGRYSGGDTLLWNEMALLHAALYKNLATFNSEFSVFDGADTIFTDMGVNDDLGAKFRKNTNRPAGDVKMTTRNADGEESEEAPFEGAYDPDRAVNKVSMK